MSLEKWKILTPLQKLPEKCMFFGQKIVAASCQKLPNLVTLSTTRRLNDWNEFI